MSRLSPAERIERAKHAAHTRWSRLSSDERRAETAPGLRAMFEHFEKQVDPSGALSEKERAKLAENARQAHLAGARRKALKAIRERQEPPAEKSDSTLASRPRSSRQWNCPAKPVFGSLSCWAVTADDRHTDIGSH